MSTEVQLAEFVTGLRPADASPASHKTAQRVLMASIGAGIAAAREDGIAELRELLQARGGRAEARTFVYGDELPAVAAAQFNGTLSRALDFCDAMAPGPHFGSAVIPAACAAAELAGGCSGSEFLAALLVGCEIGARFNLTEAMYDGFDPTGVAAVFAATAAAARILRLSTKQTLNALGLALNRCGGSFQSNIDATLAVRLIEGWVAQSGLECAQLARAGMTGPRNYLTGPYGYAHLFGRDRLEPHEVVGRLGDEWRMNSIVFKKYPSCGATQGMTELTLQLVRELELKPESISRVEVRLNPYCHRLVGQPFEVGENPRVNAQFSAQYCIANALSRRSSKLSHFRPSEVSSPDTRALIGRITCVADPTLDARGHSSVDLAITTARGHVHSRTLDISPGFPGNELSDADHRERFEACMEYAPYPLPAASRDRFLEAAADLPALIDARQLIDDLMVARTAPTQAART